jgi:hypothetical protein
MSELLKTKMGLAMGYGLMPISKIFQLFCGGEFYK